MSSDQFQFRQFTVRQDRCAMKVGTDGTLLGAWAQLPPAEGLDSPTPHVLDVGTGTGLIALMMAQRYPAAQVVGIDIDAEAVRQARENAAVSPFATRVSIGLQDVAMTQGTYDAVVSNPPYFTASLPSPDARRTMARHTGTLSHRTLMAATQRLLSPGGQASMIVPADARRSLEAEAALAGLFLVRECGVRTAAHKPVKRWLLAFAHHPAPLERTELTLGTPPYEELVKDFYL